MQMIVETKCPQDASLDGLEWLLSGVITEGDRTRETVINKTGFRLGRRSTCDLIIGWPTVSGVHAEFVKTTENLFIRDLGSTNGTFVNGRQIRSDKMLSEGDVIQFGSAEFRVHSRNEENSRGTVQWDSGEQTSRLVAFEQVVCGDRLIPHFQPIVKLSDASTVGFEVLARSSAVEFRTPREMFDMAVQLDCETELSEVSRIVGVERSFDMPLEQTLYLNTHPTESQGAQLIQSLEKLRASAPDRSLCLEIHEASVTDLQTTAELRMALKALDIKLAYDDFGAGQARMLDLVEVPPDVLKFDISLIQNINNASPKRLKMVRMLVEMVRDFGVSPLAEGIETAAEAKVCRQLGFDFAQGFYFGRPLPDWHKANTASCL